MKNFILLFSLLLVACSSVEHKEALPLEENIETKKTVPVEKNIETKHVQKAQPAVKKSERTPEVKVIPLVKKQIPPKIESPAKKAALVIPPPQKTLKVKGSKKLFKYKETNHSKNYIYALKAIPVEVDGQKHLKIKFPSSDSYISLPIARKLKSGTIIVTAIISINSKTSKLEFNVSTGKKSTDFALSTSALKQF